MTSKKPEIIIAADQSVFDDYIVCLFDGEKRKLMNRHVMATYGMTWDEYKAYCNLPDDYPSMAPRLVREAVKIDLDMMSKMPEITVPVDQSVFDDYIVCLFDGQKRKMMHRYVMAKYGMTWDEYKAYCGLPDDYPATAPGYAREKSEWARNVGLGTATYMSVSVPIPLADKAAGLASKDKMTLQELVEHLLTEHILSIEHPDKQ
jgi:predicted transcriptional regulator